MKHDCAKWNDHLLEAALTGTAAGGLEEHLLNCAECAKELAALRARRERLDALLPLMAQGAEPPAGFHARVLAAAEAARAELVAMASHWIRMLDKAMEAGSAV